MRTDYRRRVFWKPAILSASSSSSTARGTDWCSRQRSVGGGALDVMLLNGGGPPKKSNPASPEPPAIQRHPVPFGAFQRFSAVLQWHRYNFLRCIRQCCTMSLYSHTIIRLREIFGFLFNFNNSQPLNFHHGLPSLCNEARLTCSICGKDRRRSP